MTDQFCIICCIITYISVMHAESLVYYCCLVRVWPVEASVELLTLLSHDPHLSTPRQDTANRRANLISLYNKVYVQAEAKVFLALLSRQWTWMSIMT